MTSNSPPKECVGCSRLLYWSTVTNTGGGMDVGYCCTIVPQSQMKHEDGKCMFRQDAANALQYSTCEETPVMYYPQVPGITPTVI